MSKCVFYDKEDYYKIYNLHIRERKIISVVAGVDDGQPT